MRARAPRPVISPTPSPPRPWQTRPRSCKSTCYPREAAGARSAPPAGVGDPVAIRAALASLETLRTASDPSLSVETKADVPSSPSSPRPALSIAGGLLAGLVLGIGGAFVSQALDQRLRREEQLRRLYRLPILARIPLRPRSRTHRALGPLALSPATSEAYRTLRGTLAVSRRASGSGSHAILVTGSSPSEGKTTTAINLSSSLATAGHNVILIEADLRRPGSGRRWTSRPSTGSRAFWSRVSRLRMRS